MYDNDYWKQIPGSKWQSAGSKGKTLAPCCTVWLLKQSIKKPFIGKYPYITPTKYSPKIGASI
jgi:hypothetical protein